MEEPQKFISFDTAVRNLAGGLVQRDWSWRDAERLRSIRKARGLSQTEAAFGLVSKSHINRIEYAGRRPKLELLCQLALCLDVSLEYLAVGYGEDRPLSDEERDHIFILLGANTGPRLEQLRHDHDQVRAAYERQRQAEELEDQASRLHWSEPIRAGLLRKEANRLRGQ